MLTIEDLREALDGFPGDIKIIVSAYGRRSPLSKDVGMTIEPDKSRAIVLYVDESA